MNDSPILDFGSLQLPLFRNSDTGEGLISLAQAGLFASYAETPSEIDATASAGILGEGGALAISPNSGQGTTPAYVDLIDLFEQFGITDFTEDYVSKARFEVGAFASQAVCSEGDVSSQYALGDAIFELESNLLGGLSGKLPDLAGSIAGLVEDDVNSLIAGLLQPLVDELTNAINGLQFEVFGTPVAGASVDQMSVQVSGVTDFVSAVVGSLTGEFSNPDGSLTIDLSSGSIYVDVAQKLGGLNGLAPNTEVFSDAFAAQVATAFGETITAMAQDVTNAAIGALDQLNLEISGDLSASIVGLFNTSGSFSIEGSFADFLSQSGTAPVVDVDWELFIPGFPTIHTGSKPRRW